MDSKNTENIITSTKSNEHSIKPKKSKEKCYYCNNSKNYYVMVIIFRSIFNVNYVRDRTNNTQQDPIKWHWWMISKKILQIYTSKTLNRSNFKW